MSSRPRPGSQSSPRPRPPLESLIYTCLPTLAPPRTRPSSSASSSRIDHGSDPREENERQDRVKELMEFCEEILDSRLPSSAPLDIGTLPDTARRLLAKKGDEDKGLRFNGSWSKLEKGVSLLLSSPRAKLMSRKHWLHLYLIYNSSLLYPLSIPLLILGPAPKLIHNLPSPRIKMDQWPDHLVFDWTYPLHQLNGQGQGRGRVKLKY
jgi:hypothetical protein